MNDLLDDPEMIVSLDTYLDLPVLHAMDRAQLRALMGTWHGHDADLDVLRDMLDMSDE